jgi:uncharacterized protein (DUF58 family)
LLKYSEASKSHSESQLRIGWSAGARDFSIALLLLGTALYLALQSESVLIRGERWPGIFFALTALLLALITTVTIVPRLARRVNFSQWLMPLSFSVTREGGIYILVLFLLSLAAINSGNNLLLMILALMLSAILTSGIFARASLRSVSVSLDVPENVFVGERVFIKVSLSNKKRIFPSVSIAIEDLGMAGQDEAGSAWTRFSLWMSRKHRPNTSQSRQILQHVAYFPLIPPGESRTELVSQVFAARGRYRLEAFRLSTRFPFSFFKRGERMRAEGEILVYPHVQEVSSYFHLLPFQPGRIEGRHTGRGETLFAIRKYCEGESARLVDWKATAKTGELMARQFVREQESRFSLILDTVIHPCAGRDYAGRFEKAVSLAASLASHFSDEGAEFEFLSPREFVPRGMGAAHLYRILRALAIIECRPEAEPAVENLRTTLAGVLEEQALLEILSEKTFKIIITSKPRGSFPSSIWRSSHIIYFDEL